MDKELYFQKQYNLDTLHIRKFFQHYAKIQRELCLMFLIFVVALFFILLLFQNVFETSSIHCFVLFIIMILLHSYNMSNQIKTIHFNENMIINSISVQQIIEVLKDNEIEENTKIFLLSQFKTNKIYHIKNVSSDDPTVLRFLKFFL